MARLFQSDSNYLVPTRVGLVVSDSFLFPTHVGSEVRNGLSENQVGQCHPKAVSI